MTTKRKSIVAAIVVLVLLLGLTAIFKVQHTANVQRTREVTLRRRLHQRTVKKTTTPQPTVVNWHAPSETNHAYPDVSKYPNLQIDVSIKKQRVYLENDGHVLYTMLASTGKPGSATPRGNFKIQPERGLHFYNASSGEGANYWVSFKGNGIYLFHSVPVDIHDHYVVSQANQLGKKSNSHGCVRLSIADAKWMYENIPLNTPVHIH